ncbi:LSMH [Enterospora canceri]|uniref:LSMH n=1 Tax=Enterospora canceri TaxID=1081671 RepID=A0A1Y1S9Q4_9MICR|nr:LSMH [Enterospora canceri]
MLNHPFEAVKIYLKMNVVVHLKTGEKYKGNLNSFDEHLNVILENDDKLNFIRGENILCVGRE